MGTLWQQYGETRELLLCSQPTLMLKQALSPGRPQGGTKDVTIPQPIIAYNTHMGGGGVDLMDQHHAYYPVGRPSVKWWRYLCWWLCQSAMINAYIVFKQTQKQQGQPKIMKHISF